MNDDGSRKNKLLGNLKEEWKLFWGSFTEDKDPAEHSGEVEDELGTLEVVSLDQLKAMNRTLSSERKRLNQKLESLKKEIDLNSAKLEALKLVGGDTADTEQKISELTDFGQNLTDQLARVDAKIKATRSFENHFKKASLQEL